jgi:hypothetical protein
LTGHFFFLGGSAGVVKGASVSPLSELDSLLAEICMGVEWEGVEEVLTEGTAPPCRDCALSSSRGAGVAVLDEGRGEDAALEGAGKSGPSASRPSQLVGGGRRLPPSLQKQKERPL